MSEETKDMPNWTNKPCVICGDMPIYYQWTDYSGEAICIKCGCAYQLKWGTENQCKERDYPYVNVQAKFIEPLKEYWNETKKFTYTGCKLVGSHQGLGEFSDWMMKKYPELMV